MHQPLSRLEDPDGGTARTYVRPMTRTCTGIAPEPAWPLR